MLKTEGSAVTRYSHDGLGALTSVTLPDSTVVTYEYDARQRRVAKRRNGTVVKRWIYDGQYRVVAEVDGAGVVTSRFVYGSQSHSPDYLVRSGVAYAYVKNHLGSVAIVVDSGSGAVAQRIEYDPWGNTTSDSAPGFQPFGFAGSIYDNETKLNHMGFRDYDGITGTFTAKDPLRLAGGLGLYAYADNDLPNLVDPTGLGKEPGKLKRLVYLLMELVNPGPIRKVPKELEEGARVVSEANKGVNCPKSSGAGGAPGMPLEDVKFTFDDKLGLFLPVFVYGPEFWRSHAPEWFADLPGQGSGPYQGVF